MMRSLISLMLTICLIMFAVAYGGESKTYVGGGVTGSIANSNLGLIDSTGFKFQVLHDRGSLPGLQLFLGQQRIYSNYAVSGEVGARVNFGRTAGEELNNSLHLPRISMPYSLSLLLKPAVNINDKSSLFATVGLAVSKLSLLQTYNANIGYELNRWRPAYVLGVGVLLQMNKQYALSFDYRLECYKTVYKFVSANNFRDKFKPSFHVLALSIIKY